MVTDNLSTAWLNPADRPLAVIPARRSALNAETSAGLDLLDHKARPSFRTDATIGKMEPGILVRTPSRSQQTFLDGVSHGVDPPSGEQTPLSLYDENGFLKRNSGGVELNSS